MNKKIALIVASLTILSMVIFYIVPKNKKSDESIVDYKNASYIVGGVQTTLKNGYATQEAAPGSATQITTSYFGNEVSADFNTDGIADKAFILTQNSGGSGSFYYLALAIGQPSGFKGENTILLGDRIAPQTTEFRNGEIIVNFADRKTGEPMTAAPSVGVSKYFNVVDNKLIEIIK